MRRLRSWASRHRRALGVLIYGVLVVLLVATVPYAWTRIRAAGHVYTVDDAPAADVVIVLGAQVAPDRTHPMPYLAGRLRAAATLVRDGRAKVVLLSGDGHGSSGNETAVMTSYLTGELGIDPARVVADPYGLDTYDTCRRARDVYGISHALIVSQSYHVTRAVALCRSMGMDVNGVASGCYPGHCQPAPFVFNSVRDFFACTKAAYDIVTDRPPVVVSAPDPAVTNALAALTH